jgi:hypothetical protein
LFFLALIVCELELVFLLSVLAALQIHPAAAAFEAFQIQFAKS